MRINKETLQKIAHLSRLEIRQEDEERMIKDLTAIVSFVEKLKEVNTDGVEPLTTMSYEINVLREDKVEQPLRREDALKNAPKKDHEYFRVPKVLE